MLFVYIFIYIVHAFVQRGGEISKIDTPALGKKSRPQKIYPKAMSRFLRFLPPLHEDMYNVNEDVHKQHS